MVAGVGEKFDFKVHTVEIKVAHAKLPKETLGATTQVRIGSHLMPVVIAT